MLAQSRQLVLGSCVLLLALISCGGDEGSPAHVARGEATITTDALRADVEVLSDDSFRGRSFSVEFLMLTISFTIGALATGALYDWNGSIQETVWAACAAVVVGSLIWRALALRLSIESESPAPKAEDPEIKA